MDIFKQLSEINVNDKTEKKGKFTYLSWSFAWALAELASVFGSLTRTEQTAMIPLKDELKLILK